MKRDGFSAGLNKLANTDTSLWNCVDTLLICVNRTLTSLTTSGS